MVQNYKQTSGACSPTNTEELLTPAHEENVRFIHYTWQCVMREMQSFQGSENSNKGPQKYVERTPNPNLSCTLTYFLMFLLSTKNVLYIGTIS
uniref:MAPK regulated corepressor interacting protein 1 n=1 Tax=Pygocentrus nattereri TaxID=42514 RepID=A0A3B4D959_PYGNA